MKFEKELETAKRLARKSGDILLEVRKKSMEIILKEDKSIVTVADKLSSDLIYCELKRNFPDYGIIDEERNNNLRENKELCWVVDPLDGTLDYVNNGEHFGVMIGLMKNFKPILGVVYKPISKEMAYAVKGQNAFLEYNNQKKKINVLDSDKLILLVSKKRRNSELDEILKKLNPDKVIEMSSSFKITEVSKGNATHFVCPPSITMNLWDLCSQQIILEEAGGAMSDYYGNPINYSGELVNKFGVIASNKTNLWRRK